MLPQSLGILTCFDHVDLDVLFSWCLLPSSSYILSASSSVGFPHGRDFMETSCLDLSVPLSLHNVWLGSLDLLLSAAGGISLKMVEQSTDS